MSSQPDALWWLAGATIERSCRQRHRLVCRNLSSSKTLSNPHFLAWWPAQSQFHDCPCVAANCRWSFYSTLSGAAGCQKGRNQMHRQEAIKRIPRSWERCIRRVQLSFLGKHYYQGQRGQSDTECLRRSILWQCRGIECWGRVQSRGISSGCAGPRNCPPIGNDDPSAAHSDRTYCSDECEVA